MADRKNGGRTASDRKTGGRTAEAKNGSRGPQRKNGSGEIPPGERLTIELAKANTRITQHAQWMRSLSHDLRRLGEKVYGLTEGTVTLADVKLPADRYRTPDQTGLDSSELAAAAERMLQVKRRFLSMERDLAAADDLRAQLDNAAQPSRLAERAGVGSGVVTKTATVEARRRG